MAFALDFKRTLETSQVGPICINGGWVEYKKAEAWREMSANIRRFSPMTHQRRAESSLFLECSKPLANSYPHPSPKIKQPPHRALSSKIRFPPKISHGSLERGAFCGLRTDSKRILCPRREGAVGIAWSHESKESACIVRMGLFKKSAFTLSSLPPTFLLSSFLI